MQFNKRIAGLTLNLDGSIENSYICKGNCRFLAWYFFHSFLYNFFKLKSSSIKTPNIHHVITIVIYSKKYFNQKWNTSIIYSNNLRPTYKVRIEYLPFEKKNWISSSVYRMNLFSACIHTHTHKKSSFTEFK